MGPWEGAGVKPGRVAMQFHWELHNMVVQHCDCDNPSRTNSYRPCGSVCVLCMVWPAAPTTYKNMRGNLAPSLHFTG